MKRALAVTVFGGLLIFGIPPAASAQSVHAQHDVGEAAASGSGPEAAPKPAEEPSHPKQDAPGEGRSHYDRLHHDGDSF